MANNGVVQRFVCQEINLKSDFVVIERKSGLLAIQVRILCVLKWISRQQKI